MTNLKLTTKNTCAYCGAQFEHSDQSVDICRMCFYGGRHLSTRFAQTIERLQEVNANAGVSHTGGGCFVIEIPIGEHRMATNEGSARYVYVTDAEAGAVLPEADDSSARWMCGYYDEAIDEGSEAQAEADGLTTDDMVAWVTAIDAAHNPYN